MPAADAKAIQSATIQSTPATRGTALLASWIVAVAMLLAACIWPLVAGLTATNDDLKFIRGAEYSGTLWQDIRAGWTTQSNFRPVENLAALLCDEQSLASRGVMVIQIAGLAALAAGLARLTRRIFPHAPIALPLLLIWLMLSPATTLSLWQTDTCSQTWTAAAGIWVGVLSMAGIDAARAGRSITGHVIALVLLCAAAANVKELFYGWSAGIGIAILIVIIGLWRHERPAAWRSCWLFLAVAVVPAAHLCLRLASSALGRSLEGSTERAAGEEVRYQVSLGANLITNAWYSLLGVFANGPLHLLKDVDAPLALRLSPLAALLASFVIVSAAGALALVHRSSRPANGIGRRTLLLAAAAALLSLSVSLPMGSVSELYGFGANVGSGLLIVAGLLALWHPAAAEERGLCRTIAGGGAAALLLAGVLGFASRAYHFQLTWQYGAELNRIVLDHQRSLPANGGGARSRVYFERSCYSGAMHSQYIVSPVQALGLEQTMLWMNRIDPQRPVIFVGERVLGGLRPNDLVVECDAMPVRGHW